MLIWFFMRFIFFLYYLKGKEEYNSVHFKLVVTVSFTMKHTFCSLDVRAKFIAKLEYGSTYIYLRTYIVLNENWKELISRVTWFYRIVNEPFWFPWFKCSAVGCVGLYSDVSKVWNVNFCGRHFDKRDKMSAWLKGLFCSSVWCLWGYYCRYNRSYGKS